MSTRTVRLDEESERLLEELQATTGRSVSALLKDGLAALRDSLRERAAQHPYRIYEQLDIGPGGHALAPARKAKDGLRRVLEKKHKR